MVTAAYDTILINDNNYIVVTNLMGLLRYLPHKDQYSR